MADTATEFLNGTRNYTQLAAGVTLVANSATEQAVVRDIELNNPNTYSFKYTSGGQPVATSNGNLSGNEIVGASSSLVMTPANLAAQNQIIELNRSSGVTTLNTFTGVTLFGTVPNSFSGTNVATSLTTTLTVDPIFICFGANGDFYYSQYNSSSNANVYRRALGVNGAESTIMVSGGTQNAFDGRYISGFDTGGTTLQVYDTLTNTSIGQSSIALSGGVNFQSSTSCSIDGYLWIRSEQSAPSYLVNLLTRTIVQQFGTSVIPNTSTSNSRQNSTWGKDSKGNYYLMVGLDNNSTPSNGTMGVSFGKNLASPSANLFTLSTNNLVPRTNYTANRFFSTPNRLFSFAAGQSGGLNTFVCNWDTLVLSQVTASNYNNNGNNGAWLAVDSTRANTDFGNIGIRATGIKTTP